MKTDSDWGKQWDSYWRNWLVEYKHTIKGPGEDMSPLEFDADYVKDKIVFEIGCGIGLLAAKINSMVLCYYGIDISPFAVEFARTLCPDETNFSVVQTEQDYKIAKDSLHKKIDTVLVRHVFIHLGEEKVLRYLNLARSVLKPDGVLYCNFFRPVAEGSVYIKKDTDQTSGAVVYFPKDHIYDILGRSGFKVIKMAEVAERYEVIAM